MVGWFGGQYPTVPRDGHVYVSGALITTPTFLVISTCPFDTNGPFFHSFVYVLMCD